MIPFDDTEFGKTLAEAFKANPEQTGKLVKLMIDGCEAIERFETNLAFARAAPFLPDTTPEEFEEAIDDARAAFGAMIDVFGEVLDIATAA
jgi:hypothetical protein